MITGFDWKPSIDYAIRQLEKKFKSQIALMEKFENDPQQVYRAALSIAYEDNKKKRKYQSCTGLTVYFILKKKFRLAWISRMYASSGYGVIPLDRLTSKRRSERGSGLQDFESLWSLKRTSLMYSLIDEEVNQEFLRVAHSLPYGETYDRSPEARYKEQEDEKEFYIRSDSMGDSRSLMEMLMAMDRNEEAVECLFRLQHVIVNGSISSSFIDPPTFTGMAAYVQAMNNWLQARFEKDTERRKSLGWSIVYWLVISLVDSLGKGHAFEHEVDALCSAAAEFELFAEEEMIELYRYFKISCVYYSRGMAEKLRKEPTKLLTGEEIGAITTEEAFAIYDEIAKSAKKK
jgi:hypothetical protein